MPGGMFRIALVIGLLSTVGPFAIDMYLPALPAVAADLGASAQATQFTLTAFFAAFGVSQLVYGPLSDRQGRKPPLYYGMAIFLVGSIGCALAPGIGTLIAARFVQGLGAATVMVVPRAIIRDLHTGPEATRLMATVMLVISISPMLAPLGGSAVMALSGWRAIFGVLVAMGLASLALTAWMLPETLDPASRAATTPRALASGLWRLLRDRDFMGLTLIGGFSMASFFIFIASASFVYTSQFGLSPTGFSLAFAVNAIGFFGASQMAASLGERFGMARVILTAVAMFALLTALLLLITLLGYGSFPVIVALLFCANAFLGVVMPTTMVMALDPHPDIAGLASSLGGTLQMLTGGAMIALAGPFFNGTALPMVAAIAAAGLLALAAAYLTLGGEAATMIPLDRLDQIRGRFEFLEARLNAGAAVADLPALSREYAELRPVVERIDAWRGLLAEEEETARLLADPEMRALAEEELARIRAALPGAEHALRLALVPRDAADARSAILEIRPGTGGDEAALFAGDLVRMYQRLAERRGWRWDVVEAAQTELGGVKEFVAEVSGEGVYAQLKFESGVHRVQRVPVTESGGRIHTSAATVAVLPEAEEVEVEIPPGDLRIDTMRSSGAGGQHVNTTDSAVRITHLPTGIVVTSSEKSQHQNRARAMQVLRARLYDLERQRQDNARAAARKGQVGSGDRSERIRTYNFPQGRLTDHRIGLTLHKLDQVLQGDLDDVVEALITADQAARLGEFGG